MSKGVMSCFIFLVISFAYSQWEPSWETKSEVNEAADFTDGFQVACPDLVVNVAKDNFGARYFLICVDTSSTGWSSTELTQWADYGFAGWSVLRSWKREDGGMYSKIIGHGQRNEAVLITVMADMAIVVYLVYTT